jgi:hypothetical protein
MALAGHQTAKDILTHNHPFGASLRLFSVDKYYQRCSRALDLAVNSLRLVFNKLKKLQTASVCYFAQLGKHELASCLWIRCQQQDLDRDFVQNLVHCVGHWAVGLGHSNVDFFNLHMVIAGLLIRRFPLVCCNDDKCA